MPKPSNSRINPSAIRSSLIASAETDRSSHQAQAQSTGSRRRRSGRTPGTSERDPGPPDEGVEMAARKGSAEWKGDLKGGGGTVTVGDDAWTGNYSFTSRFEEGEGTNPEELI